MENIINQFMNDDPILLQFEVDVTQYFIDNYKEIIEDLDDCIFVDIIEELHSFNVDLKQFDELLNKEDRTDSENTYVCYLIFLTKKLISQHIDKKIEELSELRERL